MLGIELNGPVLRLRLDRPEVRNALDDVQIARLSAAFTDVGPAVRVVVLSGAGKSFCAGGDLEWMRRAAAYSETENYEDAVKLAGLFRAIVECPACVIAQVHGAAFGGGAGLVACADVAIAAEGSLFAFSEARLGLVPATISPFVVSKIGLGHARALFATAEAFEAGRAERIGLVHEVVPQDGLEAAVESKIAAVLRCGSEAVALSKRLTAPDLERLDDLARLLARARSSAEGTEGVAAFLEKRPATFVAT